MNLQSEPDIGCGNFFSYALRACAAPDAPLVWLDTDQALPADERATVLSLSQIDRLTRRYATAYVRLGVIPGQPIAVYLRNGAGYLLQFVALSRLGAIPVLVNGNMLPEIVVPFLRKVGAQGLLVDDWAQARLAREMPRLRQVLPWIQGQEGLATLATDRPLLPHVHAPQDVVLISHSSGTTGIPKAVVFAHQQFFQGTRHRLGLPTRPQRILTALPHAHSAGLAFQMFALLTDTPLFIASEESARSVLPQIAHFRPTSVVAFAKTHAEIADAPLGDFDLASVKEWVNTGDAVHERHIRRIVSEAPGSVFVDGLGSSEMGFSVFRQEHTYDSSDYGRCVGTPVHWAQAEILTDDGLRLGPNQVGRLAVRSPSITPGYWNDPELTAAARRGEFFLTGDVAYRDERGRFYQVDRVPDVIHTPTGPAYSLVMEELILNALPEVKDCSVVALTDDAGRSAPAAVLHLEPEMVVQMPSEADTLITLNAVLRADLKTPGVKLLVAVVFMERHDVPHGPTGKVLKRALRDGLHA